MRNFKLARSPIHGVGVFTLRDILNGRTIGWMEMQGVGKVGDFDRGLPSTGVVDLNGDVKVPLSGFPLWAVNWAKEPNIAASVNGEIYTLRDIQQGEELTIAYHSEAVKEFADA